MQREPPAGVSQARWQSYWSHARALLIYVYFSAEPANRAAFGFLGCVLCQEAVTPPLKEEAQPRSCLQACVLQPGHLKEKLHAVSAASAGSQACMPGCC